jgi:hypothetical protein
MSAAGEDDDDDDMERPEKVKDDREWQEANADAPTFVTDGRHAKDASAVLEKAAALTSSKWLRCANAVEWRDGVGKGGAARRVCKSNRGERDAVRESGSLRKNGD